MANEGDGWSGSGANPWHLDATTESVLFLTNESNQPARVGLSITAENVHYYLTSLELAPYETRAIDIRQLRDAAGANVYSKLKAFVLARPSRAAREPARRAKHIPEKAGLPQSRQRPLPSKPEPDRA